MKTVARRARRMTRLEKAARLLPRTFLIIKFTPAQIQRIRKAARSCGWTAGESGAFCAQVLLRNVKGILRS
jgi:hypothetical protein